MRLTRLVLGACALVLAGCSSSTPAAPAPAGPGAWAPSHAPGAPVVDPASWVTVLPAPAYSPGVPRYGVGDPPAGRGERRTTPPKRVAPDSSEFGTPPAEEARRER